MVLILALNDTLLALGYLFWITHPIRELGALSRRDGQYGTCSMLADPKISTRMRKSCEPSLKINKHILITYPQGRPSRGFQGVTCTPAFLPSPGNSYIRKKCTFFPEIPRLVHPCYLGRMGAPDNEYYPQAKAKAFS